MKMNLSGAWRIELTDGTVREDGFLPGTLDENRIGNPDKVAGAWHPDMENRETEIDKLLASDKRIATRLTRNYTYEGSATFTKIFHGEVKVNKRYFLFAERARAMTLKVDGESAPLCKGGLSVPYVFEVTGLLKDGSQIEITTDNSYPGMPYKDITCSSAATDETQTNWNGVVGELIIEEKEKAFISNLKLFRKSLDMPLEAEVEISYGDPSIDTSKVRIELDYKKGALLRKWDEYEGKLFPVKVSLYYDGVLADEKEVSYGVREIGYDESGRLTLNGRRIFLRSEANCGLFPETGHAPMDKDSWLEIMKTYASYGVNCVRFHSWCPPEAAFAAADELGMMVQPELPNWNPRDAFSTEESKLFYENELKQIIKTYGNHPSFVMMTLGNELHCDDSGIDEMHRLMDIARDIDPTKLYAWGSNNFYGEKGADEASDFYTSSNVGEAVLRLAMAGNKGRINTETPNTVRNFDSEMKTLRKSFKKPFFSFEVGQYEVLPDLHELEEFRGITRPDNLQIVKDRLEKSGMPYEEYERRVAASGELALLTYREEIEAVLRTPEMSGISLLGLQDFTGQGTALVGMMNSHLRSKTYDFAKPERFKEFFEEQVILVEMEKYVYTVGETIKAEVKVANYGKESLPGSFNYEISANRQSNRDIHVDGGLYKLGSVVNEFECPVGEVTSLGTLEVVLDNMDKPARFDLTIRLAQFSKRLGICLQTDKAAIYPIWIFPDSKPECPKDIYETKVLDEKAIEVLKDGGKVFYCPDSTKEAIPNSIKAQFSTDFWSVGTFPFQEGAMGQFIDKEHPLFENFPTEEHSNFQWFQMASQRAFVLPRYMKAIVAEMDSYVRLRPMAQLLEAKAFNGRIMMSSMGLHNLLQYPEAKALLCSIYDYMDSNDYEPSEVLSEEEIKSFANVYNSSYKEIV